jgi:hypothetical protein
MRTLRVLGKVLSFWRIAYSAGTWRRIGYVLVALPASVVCLALVLTGRTGTAAGYQRRLARGLAGPAPGGAAAARPGGVRVLVSSVAGVVISLVSWVVLQYIAFLAFINLAFPLRNYLVLGSRSGAALPWWGIHRAPSPGNIWASTYHNSWGGPTLAGAWAVHAGLVLISVLPVLLWAIRGLTRLQGRLTRALLGGGPATNPVADVSPRVSEPAPAR